MKYKRDHTLNLEEASSNFESSTKKFYKLFKDPYANNNINEIEVSSQAETKISTDPHVINSTFLQYFGDKFNSPKDDEKDSDSLKGTFCSEHNIILSRISQRWLVNLTL